ncbi:MAG TPA: hypothetical protein VD761_09080 [Solirubrobacterales bacterium]|nr:hypothetical protein [Solirubrobacterales bacterium]
MRFLAAALLLCLALLASGCGDDDDSTPVACLEGAPAYERALASAPGAVRLEGETPISECLARNQTSGDLSRVGEAMIETATALNAEARVEPGGEANLQLGYLLGAAERGSEESEGIHTDLVRRLIVAARFAPGKQPIPREFVVAYREGFDAGRSGG